MTIDSQLGELFFPFLFFARTHDLRSLASNERANGAADDAQTTPQGFAALDWRSTAYLPLPTYCADSVSRGCLYVARKTPGGRRAPGSFAFARSFLARVRPKTVEHASTLEPDDDVNDDDA